MTINRAVSMTDWDAGVRPKIERINSKWGDLTWGTYNGHDPTKGRATDGMLAGYKTPAGNSRGWACARWLWENRESLGIWYVIFDGKIISKTRPAAGWRTYFPTQAAIDNSPDSAYHRNHPHVSFYKLEAPVKFLPPYLVDPQQVTTGMVANATQPGQDDLLRPPLYRIDTGIRIDTRTDAEGNKTQWLVTASLREYYLPFLVLESDYLKRPTTPPKEPELTKVRIASYNILSDRAGIAGGEGSLASRLPKIIDTINLSRASVLFLQECNRDAAALVQGELGADWVWSRVGTRTVMVDKTVWTMGEERKVALPSPHIGADKTFPLVELTHNNGDKVWACSVHFVSSSGNDATGAQIDEERRLSAEKIVEVFKPLKVAIGGGDLNTSSMKAGKAKPVLVAGGLSLMTKDATFDSKTVDSFPNSTPGAQHIDEIWVKGCKFLDGDIIEGKGSDHNLLVAEIELGR